MAEPAPDSAVGGVGGWLCRCLALGDCQHEESERDRERDEHRERQRETRREKKKKKMSTERDREAPMQGGGGQSGWSRDHS